MAHQMTQRVLDILELLAAKNKTGLTFMDIAKSLDIPKGSLHPILVTLAENRYVNYQAENRRYYLGDAVFALGSAFVNNKNLLEQINGILSVLAGNVGATCYLGIMSDGYTLYLLQNTVMTGYLQVMAKTGYKLPAYCTSLGKALMCDFSMEKLHSVFPDGLKAMTPNTVTSYEELFRQFGEVQRTGISTEIEESAPYIRCFGTPIRYRGKVIAAISVSFPIVVDDEDTLSLYKRRLLSAGKSVEAIISQNPSEWIYSDINV